jgi:pyruvate dehydrogenase E2 component (dihydrolipoamide acetyltransferase)
MTDLVLKMPRLGETMDEGRIGAWLVAPGVAFRRGDAILELETDKTVVEYPALGDGVMGAPLVAPGDMVAVGAPIAQVTVAHLHDWQDMGTASAEAPVKTTQQDTAAEAVGAIREIGAPVRATPVARRLARQAGIALDSLTGTGRRGRIEAADVQGPGDASDAATGPVTFVLIHGFAGDGSAWSLLSAALTRAGHPVLTPDLAGHGANPTPAISPDDLVAGLLRDLADVPGPMHLVGHSLGAWVAVQTALKLGPRVAALTLIAPAGAGREIADAFVRGMAEAATAGELRHLLAMLGPRGGMLTPPLLQTMADVLAQGRLRDLAQAISGPNGQRIDILQPLTDLPARVPVRVLIGTADRIIPPLHAMNLPPRVAVHFLTAGHMPQWDAPADVAGLVLNNRAG